MTTPVVPAQQKPQPPSTQQVVTDTVLVAGLAALLAAAVPSVPSIASLLMRSRQRVSRTGATAAARIVLQWGQPDTEPLGPAGRYMQRLNIQRRAQYLLAAARRITAQLGTDHYPAAVADAIRRELQYWRQHVHAGTRREQAASLVDSTADQHGRPSDRGTVLGWRSARDERVTAECRAADGKNWIVEHPPRIGLPGAVHVACRCIAVRPFPTRQLVDGGLLPEVPR